MKKIIYITCCALCILSMGCSKEDDNTLPQITPEATGTFTDTDGTEYPWVRYNGLDWMAANYKGGTPYYEEIKDQWGLLPLFEMTEETLANFETYGNLYSYDDAVNLAPEGWRLPTDEDWQKLEQAMGMDAATAGQTGWRGSLIGELLQQDESGSGMHMLLGGYINIQAMTSGADLRFRYLHTFGYYWSSTLGETSAEGRVAYYRRIGTIHSGIERNLTLTEEQPYADKINSKYMSVRYVRDAQ